MPEFLGNDAYGLERFVPFAPDDPNLLFILDVSTQGGVHYLVSEFA